MNRVLHIVRKDLPYAAVLLVATAALFFLSAGLFVQSSGPLPDAQSAALLAWMIATGALWQREPLPGRRAYWLARPVNGHQLLLAKSLTVILAVYLPILITHAAIVATNGLPVAPHLPALAANAATIVALYILPVAVLAAITTNLRQLILWTLAIHATGLLLMEFRTLSGAAFNIAFSVIDAITIAGMTAMLLWQYRTRATAAGRIAVVALTLLTRALPLLVPASSWLAFEQALSPALPVRLAATAKASADDAIPVRAEGLAPGQSAVIGANEGAAFVRPQAISTVTVYDAPITVQAAVGETFALPGLGRCQSWSDGYLRMTCHTVLGSPWRIDARWTGGGETSIPVLRIPEDSRWFAAHLRPVFTWRGGTGTQSVYRNGRITVTLRKPIARLQRPVELASAR